MALQQALGTNIPRTGVRLPPTAPTTEAPDPGAEFTALQQKAQTQLEPLQQQRAQLSALDIASKQQTAREQGMLQQRQAEGNELNQALVKWEYIYNTIRPHQSLGYLTPQRFLEHKFSKILRRHVSAIT